MHTEADFAHFRQAALDEGFDEVIVRDWAPGLVLDIHGHPFAASALLVRGEMWLTIGGDTRHLGPATVSRSRQTNRMPSVMALKGATYWVARRHPPRAPADADAA